MRLPTVILSLLLCSLAVGALAAPATATQREVELEKLTWTEVRDAVHAGCTTVILPVGGTEQNGPHMVLGKHNARVRLLAGRIAVELGDALVAPVLAYVPEGRIDPPSGHMRFPGTISVPDAAFVALLEAAARSLRQAGFVDVVLIGDSGNYQPLLRQVAAQLNREWARSAARAHHVEAYYRATQAPYVDALRRHGLSAAQIGHHAGAADTALSLALDPALVRADRLDASAAGAPGNGVDGDPRAATPALGELAVAAIVTDTVVAIRHARRQPR